MRVRDEGLTRVERDGHAPARRRRRGQKLAAPSGRRVAGAEPEHIALDEQVGVQPHPHAVPQHADSVRRGVGGRAAALERLVLRHLVQPAARARDELSRLAVLLPSSDPGVEHGEQQQAAAERRRLGRLHRVAPGGRARQKHHAREHREQRSWLGEGHQRADRKEGEPPAFELQLLGHAIEELLLGVALRERDLHELQLVLLHFCARSSERARRERVACRWLIFQRSPQYLLYLLTYSVQYSK